jgi:hypothetical protein
MTMVSSLRPAGAPSESRLEQVTKTSVHTLAQLLSEMAAGKEVIVLWPSGGRVYANYVTRGTFAVACDDDSGLVISGTDLRDRGDINFWSGCRAGEASYLLRPGHSVDIYDGETTLSYRFVEPDESKPPSVLLTTDGYAELGELITEMAQGCDVLAIRIERGLAAVAFPMCAQTFGVIVDVAGLQMSGDYLGLMPGSIDLGFNSGVQYVVRPRHSIEIITDRCRYDLRFVPAFMPEA